MDEPTSSLTTAEKERLFRLIRSFKDEGRSIIYISHFLDEVVEIADRCTSSVMAAGSAPGKWRGVRWMNWLQTWSVDLCRSSTIVRPTLAGKWS